MEPKPVNRQLRFVTWQSEAETKITLLQLGTDGKLLRRSIEFNLQHVRLAADLAVFNVTLAPTSELIDRGRIPLSTSRALKASVHPAIIYAQKKKISHFTS